MYRLLPAMVLLVLTPGAFAAETPALPAPQVRSGVAHVVDGVRTFIGEGVSILTRQQPQTRTISLQIPDYKPEYADSHWFVVVKVHEYGSEVKRVGPDENGVLNASFGIASIRDADGSRMPLDEASFFYSVNIDTKQVLFTMDLEEVPLVALVKGMELAFGGGYAVAEPAPFARPEIAPRLRKQDVYGIDTWLTIRGEHMTLQETLDLIYQQTGCEVFREQERLLITACH